MTVEAGEIRALVCGSESLRQAADVRTGNGGKLQEFTPRRLHQLDLAVRQGRIRHVIFGTLADLLDAVWEEEISFDDWTARGVRIEFIAPPPTEPYAAAQEVFRSWQAWKRRSRRRQLVAGVILSTLILILCFLLVWLPLG